MDPTRFMLTCSDLGGRSETVAQTTARSLRAPPGVSGDTERQACSRKRTGARLPGFDGQSGSPRLVPMARTEDAFIAYVRKPSTAAMPPFTDVPTADLANIYAYMRSLPPEAPPIESIPLLKDILEQVKKR